VADDGNDAAALLAELRAAEAAAGEEGAGAGAGAWVVRLLSRIRGPWALVFWHAPSQRLWWGRDAIGRRRCVHRGRAPGDLTREMETPLAAVDARSGAAPLTRTLHQSQGLP
jgi:hypothetical protein